jgi:hypothetical protein
MVHNKTTVTGREPWSTTTTTVTGQEPWSTTERQLLAVNPGPQQNDSYCSKTMTTTTTTVTGREP